MASTQTTTQTQTSAPADSRNQGSSSSAGGRQGPPTAEEQVNNMLNQALQCTGGGPGGPGGPGSPGGPGGPGQPAGGAGAPQTVIPAAPDVKAMGAIPDKFNGNRQKAENFLEDVLGYL
jgi:hypothetical protein